MAGGDIISFGKKNLRNWIWFGKLISYHGRKKMKQCAVVLRMAPTWYRFEFSSHLFRQLCTVFLCQNSFQQIFDNFVIGLAALRYWPGATRCQHLTNFALKQATCTSRWPVRQLIWPSVSLIMKNTWYYSRRLLRRLWIDGVDASSQQYIQWNYISLLLGWWNIDDLYRGQNTIPSLPFHSPPHHPKDQACSLLCTYYNGNQCFPMGMKGYPPLLALPHHQHSKMASSPESHPRNLFLHHFHADQVFSFSEGCKGRSFRPKHGKLAFPDSLLLPSSCSVDHQLWLFPPYYG